MLLGLFTITFTVCGKGQRLGKDKECKYCQVNTYNDNENHFDSKCKACPEGKTSVMGAESESDCTLKSEYLGAPAQCTLLLEFCDLHSLKHQSFLWTTFLKPRG